MLCEHSLFADLTLIDGSSCAKVLASWPSTFLNTLVETKDTMKKSKKKKGGKPDWAEAKKLCRLNATEIQMAKELGDGAWVAD